MDSKEKNWNKICTENYIDWCGFDSIQQIAYAFDADRLLFCDLTYRCVRD